MADICKIFQSLEGYSPLSPPFSYAYEDHDLCIDIRGNVIKMSETVKLLGVTIDSKLSFNGYVKTICQKTKNKHKAFSRIAKNLDYQKASLLYNSFILTNFNYCPLIWIFCGKTANEEVNRVHKGALRVLLNDYDSTFEELLHRNEEVTIHVKICKNLCYRYTNVLPLATPLFCGSSSIERCFHIT